uniref:Uncharacterized protein n=1 Tax=Anser brachyrhynchus TaxID=132585 RepID=A0A8B9I6R3_9AVES
MVQAMIPKSWRAMRFYFSTIYQEVWVGIALTAYTYYKISYATSKCYPLLQNCPWSTVNCTFR